MRGSIIQYDALLSNVQFNLTVIDLVSPSVSGVKGCLSSGFQLFMVQLFDDRPQRNLQRDLFWFYYGVTCLNRTGSTSYA